jgi:hypothetical protein
MKRRRLLSAGLLVATGLAGCNTGGPDEEPTGTATDSPSATTSPAPDPADAPIADELDSYRFDIVGGANPEGQHSEEIDVTFEPAANAVVVSGTVVVAPVAVFGSVSNRCCMARRRFR